MKTCTFLYIYASDMFGAVLELLRTAHTHQIIRGVVDNDIYEYPIVLRSQHPPPSTLNADHEQLESWQATSQRDILP